MKDFRFSCAIVLLAVAFAPPLGAVAADLDQAEPPNVLMILADDLGYEALGSYGGHDFETPNIDRLAESGVRLTRVYTSAVCTPSRMSYYTGRYVVNHGYRSVLPVHVGSKRAVDFSRQFATLPQALRKAGYATSVTGKWQLAALEFHPGHINSAGFESWCVWQIWRKGAKTTRYWDPCFNHDGRVRDDIADRYGPDVLAEYVIAEMRDAVEEGRPFYVHHNMLLPHWPILETPADRATGSEASLAGMIRYMDGIVGRLVAAVDELGIADHTWVMFLGDNGTDSRQPRRTDAGTVRGGKHHLGDAGMHIPAIVRGPGIAEGGRTFDDLVDMADFFPTLCELTGAAVPEDAAIDGVSFAGQLLATRPAPARDFVTAAYGKDDCVFDGEWRLHRLDDALFDCRNLPEEKRVEEGSTDPVALSAAHRLGAILGEIKTSPDAEK